MERVAEEVIVVKLLFLKHATSLVHRQPLQNFPGVDSRARFRFKKAKTKVLFNMGLTRFCAGSSATQGTTRNDRLATIEETPTETTNEPQTDDPSSKICEGPPQGIAKTSRGEGPGPITGGERQLEATEKNVDIEECTEDDAGSTGKRKLELLKDPRLYKVLVTSRIWRWDGGMNLPKILYLKGLLI